MRFMMLVKHAENAGRPPQALIDAIEKLGGAATKSGAMVQSGGLAPAAQSTRVRVAKGQLTTTDGPFTEAKEVVGGFAIFNLPSKEEAVKASVAFMDFHRQHWPGWEGELEIRQIFGPEDAPPRA